MAGMAYKMLRVRDISTSTYSHVFLDIGTLGQPAWIQKAVETNLAHQVITPNREFFYPDAQVTRAESFAMIMAAVFLYPTGASGQDWQKKLYDVAFAN